MASYVVFNIRRSGMVRVQIQYLLQFVSKNVAACAPEGYQGRNEGLICMYTYVSVYLRTVTQIYTSWVVIMFNYMSSMSQMARSNGNSVHLLHV